jgi:uroporphyrinogen-III decarboxylase
LSRGNRAAGGLSQRLFSKVFGPGGGFVFNTIHNVQPKTPIENVLAMYETVRDHGHYPLL